jgi:uncharacterized protein
MRGTLMRPRSWQEILDNDERCAMLVPMLILENENNANLELRSPPVLPDARGDLITLMIASVTQLYRYFARARLESEWLAQLETPMPFRRATPKIGRNDPCPCGSGKKYKTCCAD